MDEFMEYCLCLNNRNTFVLINLCSPPPPPLPCLKSKKKSRYIPETPGTGLVNGRVGTGFVKLRITSFSVPSLPAFSVICIGIGYY